MIWDLALLPLRDPISIPGFRHLVDSFAVSR